jgi:hypothetical protein
MLQNYIKKQPLRNDKEAEPEEIKDFHMELSLKYKEKIN